MSIKLWFRGLSAFVLTIILSLTLFSLPANAFVASDVPVNPILVNRDRLLEKNECNKCNLSGVNLSGEDLYGSALIGANLTGANLSNTLLNDAKLDKANLTGANLSGSSLLGIG